jgi:molybdopterin-guanine dinucleotide biosynthesis protein A
MGGGAKAAEPFLGKPLLEHVIERFGPQVERLYLNANGDTHWLAGYSLPVIGDAVADYPGPLAGLHAFFCHRDGVAENREKVALVPCDGPFVPLDLVAVLAAAMNKHRADVACVRYDGEWQPTFSLWHRRTATAVADQLLSEKHGGFRPLLAKLRTSAVDWPPSGVNPFFNINTPEDLRRARQGSEA